MVIGEAGLIAIYNDRFGIKLVRGCAQFWLSGLFGVDEKSFGRGRFGWMSGDRKILRWDKLLCMLYLIGGFVTLWLRELGVLWSACRCGIAPLAVRISVGGEGHEYLVAIAEECDLPILYLVYEEGLCTGREVGPLTVYVCNLYISLFARRHA